jgi:hypothetical protein
MDGDGGRASVGEAVEMEREKKMGPPLERGVMGLRLVKCRLNKLNCYLNPDSWGWDCLGSEIGWDRTASLFEWYFDCITSMSTYAKSSYQQIDQFMQEVHLPFPLP